RVWIENDDAFATVDIANASYALMLRLLAYSYTVRRPVPQKALCLDLAMGLMRAATILAERAARLPAGPSNPHSHAGVSFTALRDAGALPLGRAAHLFFTERLAQFAAAGAELACGGDARALAAAGQFGALARRAAQGLSLGPAPVTPVSAPAAAAPPVPSDAGEGVEVIRGERLDLIYEGSRCIHSRFCVTLAPRVFLANVKGPWIHPDAIPVERLVAVSEQCPSGAIRYRRRDGQPDERAPEVNLATVREAGPYAFHGALEIDGRPAGFRATLCRCGASRHKPFCDGSHREAGFAATGEPPSTRTEALEKRDGPLALDPQPDGPLKVSGNLEILAGSGRVIARVASAYLCRCGASATKPFCDGSHRRIGFKST
ncbi:MAG TPA: CDGSH iron-sulfur domain-containing protein, partial [Steroidobacteraceae bacterium]|nr:CDGSH iron-sulfur domain-containing protein [Steroidobacteraceae bacterium]